MKKTIRLPFPQKEMVFPLMKAIEKRRSIRKWKNDSLSDQDIANILWVACGITKVGTRFGKSRRASPSACNSQAIKVYIALKEGLFLYDECGHQIIQILSSDIRPNICRQKMMHTAAMALIYVSDYSKMKSVLFKNDDLRWFITGMDAGFIGQNVYLYCTAAKLGTVFVALVNRNKLHELMCLNECEKIICAQMVGKIEE